MTKATHHQHKLFLLDAMALIYRAHFAFIKAPRVTSTGLNTSAVFGFTNTLLEVLEKEKPTHLGVAFDTSAPTFRHTSFEAYKAQRQEQPEDITVAIPIVKKILQAFNIPILELDGYEADDIIGTFAWKVAQEECCVYMMTPDKDYCQLVRENVLLYKPNFMGKGVEVLGIEEVKEKWEVNEPSQVIDILGLMGDAVDNIPGIPGIGEKTAKKLIQEFGTVENLIANVDKLKGKQAENVKTYAEQGLLSKQLATIDTNVPLNFDYKALEIEPVNKEAVKAIFTELEFRTMLKRVIGEEDMVNAIPQSAVKTSKAGKPSIGSSAQGDLFSGFNNTASATVITENEGNAEIGSIQELATAANTKHHYIAIDSFEKAKDLAAWLLTFPSVCFDTETDNLDALQANLVGLSFAVKAKEAFYVPLPSERKEALEILELFKPLWENVSIEKIGQNIKYDINVLRNYGIEVHGPLFDTMLAHYLLEPDKRHGMDTLSANYLGYKPISITELIGEKGAKQGNMREVPLPLITEYAAEDADVTLQLKQTFAPLIEEKGLSHLLYTVEGELINVLSEMEHNGIAIDTEALKESSFQLANELSILEKEIWEMAGEQFTINSPKQLGYILFDRLKLDPKAKKTASGQYATGEEILSKMASIHPLPAKILEYRELQKLKSTYVDALPQLISEKDGRLHTSFNQAVAATGRLSSTNPNLQNIPIRTEKGREIRKAFVPKNEEHFILSADYSQIELRIMASFSKDETMIKAFQDGKDIHAITASKLYKVPLEEVNSDMRRKAKTANFGIIYGISAFGLSQRLDIPRKEAAEIIENYFAEFPAVKQYMDRVINEAREVGYVQTILGRRRYLPDINSRNQTDRGFAERNAINAPIQGSAADMIKVAMVNVHKAMKQANMKSKLLLQVHDELLFDVHKSEVEALKVMLTELMPSAIPFDVPMEIGIGVGNNWLEAH